MIKDWPRLEPKLEHVFRVSSWCNTKPTNNPTTVPKWNGDAEHFDDYQFYRHHVKKMVRNQVIIVFLVARLILGLIGRTREHLRVVGDFAVEGGLEEFLVYKRQTSSTGRGNSIREVHSQNQTCEE